MANRLTACVHDDRMKGILVFFSLMSAFASCSTDPCLTHTDPWPDPSGTRLNLAQCWDRNDLIRFYTTSLGTQMVPYQLIMPLELALPDQADPNKLIFTGEPFLTKSHIEERWRFLVLEPTDWDEHSDVHKEDIEAGWPVGFVIDERTSGRPEWQGKWIGPTCAACHTGQIEYQGKKLRVAGGPSMADFNVLFLRDLTNSLVALLEDGRNNGSKFAKYVEGYVRRFGAVDPKHLLEKLKEASDERAAWHRRNDPPDPPGYGRLDAFGVIYNEIIQMTGKKPVGTPRTNAPVSIPYLWHFSSHNQTQWNGSGPAVPLIVNVAGALGIFAKYDTDAGWFGDPSTIQLRALRKLQDLIDGLRSPKWPQTVLGMLDAGRATKGRALFESKCRGCHAEQPRDLPLGRVRVTMVPAVEMRTDSTMAENANRRELQDTNGENEHKVGTALASATFDIILSWSHPGQTLAFVGEVLSAALMPRKDLIPSGPPEAYKARPLEGIWATAPYLHNGSVPNLYEVLLPQEKRTKQFCVGSREFDPERVGFVMMTEAECRAKSFSWLDTDKEGNRNTGHDGPYFGVNTEEEIWELVEYLKSL